MKTEQFKKLQSEVSDQELIELAEKYITRRGTDKTRISMYPSVTEMDKVFGELIRRFKNTIGDHEDFLTVNAINDHHYYFDTIEEARGYFESVIIDDNGYKPLSEYSRIYVPYEKVVMESGEHRFVRINRGNQ